MSMIMKIATAAAGALLAMSAGAHAQVWSLEKSAYVDLSGALFVKKPPVGAAITPSVQIAISINGTPVYADAFGLAAPGVPANVNTVYRFGSVSKQFTAAALLSLIEEKGGALLDGGKSPAGAKATLDTPYADIFSYAKAWSEKPVTLRHMLNMQSGYASYTSPPATPPNPFDTTKPIKPVDLSRRILSILTYNKSPGGGGAYNYSNTNYFLLAQGIEIIGGLTNYQDAIRDRVLDKAGMSKSGFITDSMTGLVVAQPGVDVSKRSYKDPSWPKGAGELMGTASDLLKWHKALMDDKLMSPKARAAMFAPGPLADPKTNAYYAMGWTVSSVGTVTWASHGGTIPGFSAYSGILFDAAKNKYVSVAILINNDLANTQGGLLDAWGKCYAQLAMDKASQLSKLGPVAKALCPGA